MYICQVLTSGRVIVATAHLLRSSPSDHRWEAGATQPVAVASRQAVQQVRRVKLQGVHPEAGARPLVLLVDDDSRLVHIVAMYLRVQQIEVVSAGNGEEALRLLERLDPDLLIIDVMMPVMDGLTLTRRIRGGPRGSVPILVFTALNDEDDLAAARAAGADRVISKPFHLAGLRQAVTSLLEQGRAIS